MPAGQDVGSQAGGGEQQDGGQRLLTIGQIFAGLSRAGLLLWSGRRRLGLLRGIPLRRGCDAYLLQQGEKVYVGAVFLDGCPERAEVQRIGGRGR